MTVVMIKKRRPRVDKDKESTDPAGENDDAPEEFQVAISRWKERGVRQAMDNCRPGGKSEDIDE